MSADQEMIVDIPDDEERLDGPAEIVEPDAEEPTDGLPKCAKLQADGSVVVTLRYPVTLTWRKGDVVTTDQFPTLRLNRLTGGDMRKIGVHRGIEASIVTFACATGISMGRMNLIFDRMDSADIVTCGEVMGFLSGSSQTTGR